MVAYQQIQAESKISQTIDLLVDFAAEVRKNHNETHALANKKMRHFHQELTKRLQKKGWLRLYTLSIASDNIAALYCYSYAQKVFYYQTSYDLH